MFTRFLFYLAIFSIANLLFKNQKIAYLSVLFFLFTQYILSVAPFSNFLNPNNFTLPITLFSIYFFLKKDYFKAFILLGISFNFHAKYAISVLAMFLGVMILNYKKIRPIQTIKYFLIFLVLSTPVLIWRFSQTQLQVLPSEELTNTLRVFSPVSMFPSLWPATIWLQFLPVFVLSIISFFSVKNKPAEHNIILLFSIILIFLWIVGFVFTEMIPITPVLTLQLLRSSAYFIIFGFIYISAFLLQLHQQKNYLVKLLVLGLITFLILSPLLREVVRVAIMGKHQALFPFTVNVYGIQDEWYDVQVIFAKQNTPTDALFITPSYIEGFRAYSERSVVFEKNDASLSVFNPDFAFVARERAQDFGLTRENYRSYSKEIYNNLDFLQLAKKYDADYIVVETTKELPFNKVYENPRFIVYKVSF